MSLTDLTGQKILITGGCGAIGRVIVETFVEHGAKVGVNDILDEEQALEILKAIKRNDQIVYLRADVTDPELVGSLFDRFEKELGGLPDTVCCHAGITGSHPVQEYPVEEYDRLMAVNLRSSFLVSQEAAWRWIAASIPGHLIYTTSWVQDVPWPEITPYNVSKAGMKAMMRGFARELAPHGIRLRTRSLQGSSRWGWRKPNGTTTRPTGLGPSVRFHSGLCSLPSPWPTLFSFWRQRWPVT